MPPEIIVPPQICAAAGAAKSFVPSLRRSDSALPASLRDLPCIPHPSAGRSHVAPTATPGILAACFIVLSSVASVSAQSWPDKPVKLVVPYSAGGGVDPVARLIGQKLAERWKQPVIVENKTGASGA
ncbi:MAG: hypothetical protein JWR21_3755, partial [Herminiimonas sp.]|nr:hypothetical protein [Herminiimonas sp.]